MKRRSGTKDEKAQLSGFVTVKHDNSTSRNPKNIGALALGTKPSSDSDLVGLRTSLEVFFPCIFGNNLLFVKFRYSKV